MDICNLFYKLSMKEQGGFGIWYEYLAKLRIFRKHKKSKNVLIFGLPKKYSLGLDTLFFSNLEVVDERKENLKQYKEIANSFGKSVKIINKNLKNFQPKKKYDLVISTEVIQDNTELMSKIEKLGKKIIIFVPNKNCYAHPKISKLNSLKLKQLEELGRKNNLKVKEKGYIDCPPWPAGAQLPKKEQKKKKEPFILKGIKKILTEVTPFLAKLDKFYISPWKEINSHMIYCVFENEKL